MSIDYLQIKIVDGKDITEQQIYNALNNISGLSEIKIKKKLISAKYGNSKYLTNFNALDLRKKIITQLALNNDLILYKDIEIRSHRNDQQNSNKKISDFLEKDGLEIFISNCKFLNHLYIEPEIVNLILSRINSVLNSINGLEFLAIVLCSIKASKDSFFIGIDNATYNNCKYLTLNNAIKLRNEIINVLESIQDLDTTDLEVEIKIAKKNKSTLGNSCVNVHGVNINGLTWLSEPIEILKNLEDSFKSGIQILSTLNSFGAFTTFSIIDSNVGNVEQVLYKTGLNVSFSDILTS